MKTLKIIRNVILALFLGTALIFAILTLAGFTIQPCLPAVNYPGEDGNLAILSSSGITILSIPLLGYIVYYIMTVPGMIITDIIVLALIASCFFSFRKSRKDKTNTAEAGSEALPLKEATPAAEDSQANKSLDLASSSEEPVAETFEEYKENPVLGTTAETIPVEETTPEEIAIQEAFLADPTPQEEVLANEEIPASEEIAAIPEETVNTVLPVEETQVEQTTKEDGKEDDMAENTFMDSLILNNDNNDSTDRIAELEEANLRQQAIIEEKEKECDELGKKVAALAVQNKKAKRRMESLEKGALALSEKSNELSDMLQRALDINTENEKEKVKIAEQLDELKAAFDKNNKQYDSLYKRYAAVLDFLQNKKLAAPEACEREKNTFAR